MVAFEITKKLLGEKFKHPYPTSDEQADKEGNTINVKTKNKYLTRDQHRQHNKRQNMKNHFKSFNFSIRNDGKTRTV